MCETNADYLSDERVNLNIQLSQPILVIADLGLWNGRRMGYKEIPSGNIRDCLSGGYDYTSLTIVYAGVCCNRILLCHLPEGILDDDGSIIPDTEFQKQHLAAAST